MSFAILHQLELSWIKQLQAIRSLWLDEIMKILNLVDTMPSWLFIVLGTLFLFHHKVGIRMLFLLLLSAIFNQDLKALFAQPRPLQLDPSLAVVYIHSFGFPSGAAQTATVLAGFLATSVRKAWFWYCALFFILLISFSRVYLGVHFISDVIGGWIAGVVLLVGYLYALPPLERLLEKSSFSLCCALLALGSIAAMFLCSTSAGVSIGAFGFGVGLGFLLISPLDTPTLWSKKIQRFLIVAVGIFFLLILQKPLTSLPWMRFLFPVVSGLWIGYGGIALSRKIEKLY